VAVVDDHSMIADGLARLIATEDDLEVVGTAGTVAEAIGLVERFSPEVILMDYRLPDGDGAIATQRILQIRPETKVIMMSGATSDDTLLRTVQSGSSGLIRKSQPWAEVLEAMRTVVRGQAILRTDELAGLFDQMRTAQAEPHGGLSQREFEVLRLLAAAKSTKAIAHELDLSVNTIRNYVSNILVKLGAHSKLEAVAIARRDGILDWSEPES
jgi:DNA-binding NarL/FixJ family response regulator